ncbi:MAG: MSCRAMM family protein [Candidatus Limnocylindria bacterium]
MELHARPSRPGDMASSHRGAILVVLTLALAACAPGASPSGTPPSASAAARLALAQQERFRGIGAYDPNLIGQAAWYKVAPDGDGWEVQVRIGWGDCPAGCISEHLWVYGVTHGGSVHLISEDGDALPDATGVRGTVTSGPSCPVVTNPPDPSCADRPVAGAVLVLQDASGVEVARVTSADDGSFTVALAPGAYRLIAQPVEGLMGTPAPMDVGVEAGQPMAELTVSYDTGIR